MSVSAGFVQYLRDLRTERRNAVLEARANIADHQARLDEAQIQVDDLNEILDLFGPDEGDAAPPDVEVVEVVNEPATPAAQDGYVDDDGDTYTWSDGEDADSSR